MAKTQDVKKGQQVAPPPINENKAATPSPNSTTEVPDVEQHQNSSLSETGNDVTMHPPVQAKQGFMKFIDDLEKMAKSSLPQLLAEHNISADKFIYIVRTEVKNNPKLLDAYKNNPMSLLACIVFGAEIGLVPSKELGEYYLIPRNLKDTGLTVVPLIGYKGWCNIIYREKRIVKLVTRCVYKNDEFEFEYGLNEKLLHKPSKDLKYPDDITYAYSYVKYDNGDFAFEVLSRQEIEAIKRMNKNTNTLYFNAEKDPNMWMVKKLPLVQLAKTLPKSYHMSQAIKVEQAIEGGDYIITQDGQHIELKKNKEFVPIKKGSIAEVFNGVPDPPKK